MFSGGMGQKVNPHDLSVSVIKDWDSRWNKALTSKKTETYETQEVKSYLSRIGKVIEWGHQDKGMRNVPRKKPHQK